MALRCMIFDDSPRFLAAACGLLEREGLLVVALATNGAGAIRSEQRRGRLQLAAGWPAGGDRDRVLEDVGLGR